MVLDLKPSKIVCVGLNYHAHANELAMAVPENPILFIKPVSSLLEHNGTIILPPQSKQVDFEAELAIVIGKKCKNVSEKDVESVIAGFTCLNDVTARDLQKKDVQWTRSKSFDTFCPVGPKILKLSLKDAGNLKIQSFLNGELKQDSNTKNFIFSIEKLVSFISNVMTLEKDDIIATGTPVGVGKMNLGDRIEIKIEKIGILENFVK